MAYGGDLTVVTTIVLFSIVSRGSSLARDCSLATWRINHNTGEKIIMRQVDRIVEIVTFRKGLFQA